MMWPEYTFGFNSPMGPLAFTKQLQSFWYFLSIALNSKPSHYRRIHRPGSNNIEKGAPGCAEDDVSQVIVV